MTPVLATWSRHWRNLRAWGRPLEEISVDIVGRRGHAKPGCGGVFSTGTAWPALRRTVIRAGTDMPDALATILHEYAHLAAPGSEGHGDKWTEVFAAATREVTGIEVIAYGPKEMVDAACTSAVRTWWRSSGNEFATRLLAGRP